MQLTKLGRTGMSVSRVCLGTATFGKQTDEAESRRILDAAADARINFLDTADFYPMGRARAARWHGRDHRTLAQRQAPRGDKGSVSIFTPQMLRLCWRKR
jgi:aryl-alcohol dehydrogenase-like predicted oxidoreductase